MKSSFDLRRFKDIVAFRKKDGPALAFHSKNLELAEISEEMWSTLESTSVHEAIQKEALSDETLRPDLEAWNSEESADAQTQNIKYMIRTVTLNITQICNLHCHYCAAGGDGTYGDPVRQISVEKTLPQIKFFMEQLPPGENFHIIFLGGEPLIYPEAIRGIAIYAQELGRQKQISTSFNIITNGTLINEKFIELMRGVNPVITLSMDGAPETNDLARPQRNGKGSSEAALKGLQMMLAHRDVIPEIGIHGVFTKKNLDVLAAYKFFSSFGVNHYEFTFDVYEKDEIANREFIDQMKQVALLAFERGGEKELRKIALYNSYFTALDQQIRRTSHCGSGKSLLSLSSRNQIFACPLEISDRQTQVGEGVELNYDKLEQIQKPLIELNNCGNCWARHLCGGGCMFSHKATTGDAHQKHPTYCERTRSLILDALSYYKLTRA